MFLGGDDKVDVVVSEDWDLLHQTLVDQVTTWCFATKAEVDNALKDASVFAGCEVGLLDRN